MPTVNIFYNDDQDGQRLDEISSELKSQVADLLTCGDINLSSNEVSVRLIKNRGNGMLAPVELEITAAAFKKRVEQQDEICLKIQKFLKEKLKSQDIKVWLILSELGHSWE